jgi:glyoxylase-like metal-dependent hydrolase (beta-lactamase superfamily II)
MRSGDATPSLARTAIRLSSAVMNDSADPPPSVRPEPHDIALATPLEVAPGILLLRLPLPFALDHINVWLLEERDGWTLIDCGLDFAASRAAWETALAHDRLGGRPIRRLMVTHHHPDHIGLAGWHAARWGVPMEISAGEWDVAGRYGDRARNPHRERVALWTANGMAAEDAELLVTKMPTYLRFVHELPAERRLIAPDAELRIGGRDWRVVIGRGHAPEHVALFCAADDILISGDQVLPRISPNVSVWPDGDQNPLARFLDSLDRFGRLGRDPLVLPSHHYPFRGLAARTAEIAALHDDRLRQLLVFCAEPRSAHDCLPLLFRRTLRDQQIAFAMGEALAHLRHLAGTGALIRCTEGGRELYRAGAPASHPG